MTDEKLIPLIEKAIQQYPLNTDETIAVDIMNGLQVPTRAAKILYPAVVAYVLNVRRNGARDIERKAFAGRVLPSSRRLLADGQPVDVVMLRKELLESEFRVDGVTVSWGDATISQHQSRVDYLEKKRIGLKSTIDHHLQTIAACEAAGVDCLRDVEAAA